jgi:MYND finger
MGKQSRRTRTVRPAVSSPSCCKKEPLTKAATAKTMPVVAPVAPQVVVDPAVQGAILRRDMQRLMAEFNSLPSSMNAQRIQTFISYCGLLEQLDPKEYTHQDYTFLKKMIKTDTNTHCNTTNTGHYQVFFRVCAWMYLAGVLHCNGHYDSQGEALQYYDNVIAACDAARETDKKRILTLHGKRATIGTFLSGQRAIAADILKRVSVPSCTLLLTCSPCGQSNSSNRSNRSSSTCRVPLMAGLICDCCGTVRPENTVFMVCGGCHMAHYCSAECQKMAWKKGTSTSNGDSAAAAAAAAGHKMFCRAKHDFRVGDVVATVDPFGDTKTGKHVRIVAPAPAPAPADPHATTATDAAATPAAPTHWLVESKQDDDDDDDEQHQSKITKIVAAKRLKRVRPGLWANLGQAELAEWEKTFQSESFDIPGLTTP